MLRFLILALTLMPPAPVVIKIAGPSAVPAFAAVEERTDAHADSAQTGAHDHDGDDDASSTFTPMQEEIIADHHAVGHPFLDSLWTRHVVRPSTPLFPIARGDLFRPPQSA